MNEGELIQCMRTDPERGYRVLLDRYTGVVLRMIRKFMRDPDEVMEVYTGICERFRAQDYQALRRFQPDGKLVPWLSVVVANACRDQFRKNKAVSMPRSVLDQLEERERLVFRYYYQERYTFQEIVYLIRTRHAMACTASDVVEAVGRITSLLSAKKKWHLLAALNANTPALSLEEMKAVGREPGEPSPFQETSEDDRASQLQAAVQGLPPEDRLLVLLRFEQGMTADQIARVMDFDNRKQVYTRLRTVLNRLRRQLNETGR
ncbi:MAG: hypothetical protein D6685_08145 [Bacteroidetes bacterium]|nr:hypothetical protein AWN76_005620 [Rhodothermaceae bacterium RA]RMH63115.1 MAG: hypothetical protein D6685_08145 [Bacteroidota bacterium]